MKRPNRSPILVATIVGLVLVVAGLTALVVFQPAPAGPIAAAMPSGASFPAASTIGAIDPSTCAVQQPPGPADAPPPSGEMDVSDLGPGRYRMCLTVPTTVEVEGTAWCKWSDDRTAVIEIDGLPAGAAGGPQIAGTVGLHPPALQIEATSANGDISTFGNEGDQRLVEPGPGATTGVVAFIVSQVVDPEHPPQVPAQPRTGMIRWSCGEPPAVASEASPS